MPDPTERLNAALEGRYSIERDFGEPVVSDPLSPAIGHFIEDPLADRKRGEDVVGEVGSHVGHAAGVAGGADAPALTAEGHEEVVAALATAEIGPEIALDVGRHAGTEGILLGGGGEEGLEV